MANEIYNTTWWGNAIDTAITAGTEPDFFGSQMKMLTSQQPELVTNGDFATDSDWTLGTGITISGGSANFTGVANANINQNAGLVTGKTYKIVFTISNYVSGDIDYNVGGATRQGAVSGNGTYTNYVVSNTGQLLYFQSDQTLGFTGSIDNVSVTLARAEEVEAVKCLADWIHTTALQDLNN